MLVEFLWHLAEVDRRRLFLEMGYSSLFAFCTERLRLTRSAAFRRTTAARLLVRFPAVEEYLSDGRLCLTTLVELRDVLEDSTHETVLEQAAWKTEDEVKVLVASLRPQPTPMDFVRRVPEPARVEARPPMPEPAPVELAAPVHRAPAARSEPIDADLYRVGMTIGREFKEELDEIKAMLSHKIPDGNLEAVLRECVRVTREVYRKRRRGSDRQRAGKTTSAEGRRIPVEVRRQVWDRDEGRCTFTSRDGRRCGSAHQLEFHHRLPYAMGGAATVDNITLHCRAHNGYRADLDYGAAHMAQFRETG